MSMGNTRICVRKKRKQNSQIKSTRRKWCYHNVSFVAHSFEGVFFCGQQKMKQKKEINHSSFKNWTLVFRDSILLNVYAIFISIGIFKYCNSSGHIALYFNILERMTMLKVQFSCFFSTHTQIPTAKTALNHLIYLSICNYTDPFFFNLKSILKYRKHKKINDVSKSIETNSLKWHSITEPIVHNMCQ